MLMAHSFWKEAILASTPFSNLNKTNVMLEMTKIERKNGQEKKKVFAVHEASHRKLSRKEKETKWICFGT